MSFLKNIFAKKEDDVPEMHVKTNEPKPYYNKELKCWMIPGQEEQKLKELEEAKKGPPKRATAGNTGNLGANQNNNSNIAPSQSRGVGIIKKPNVANRYASAFPTENINTEPLKQEPVRDIEQVKEPEKSQVFERVENNSDNILFVFITLIF
jgi:hypothetical protein